MIISWMKSSGTFHCKSRNKQKRLLNRDYIVPCMRIYEPQLLQIMLSNARPIPCLHHNSRFLDTMLQEETVEARIDKA